MRQRKRRNPSTTLASLIAAVSLFFAPKFCPRASANEASSLSSEKPDDKCGLYLAISSTSTAAETKWGIYAGKDYAKGSTLGYPDVGIPAHHLKANSYFHSYGPGDEDREEFLQRNVDFFEELIWVAASAGAKFESAVGRSVAAIPGAGALSAFSKKGTNADWNVRKTYTRPSWGEDAGINHPNRGASSQFYHVIVESTAAISAGSEVFMDYGENWAQDAQEGDLTAEDYKQIDETVDQMLEFFEKHKESLDVESKKEIYHFLTRDVMTAAVGADKAKKVVAILPPIPDDLHKVKDAGGIVKFTEPSIHRSLSWLQQHGPLHG